MGKMWSWMLPQQGTAISAEVDDLFGFIMLLTLIFFVIITWMTVHLVVKYRHNQQNEIATTDLDHNTLWEAAWAFIPLMLCFVLFVWGFRLFVKQGIAPDNSLEIQVTAKQWAWQFDYPNGTSNTNLYVPAGRPVKLIMHSNDVLHSFFIPDFRVKSDVMPNRYTTVWFEAREPGQHHIFCTEYCGTDHSNMNRTVFVLPEDDYQAKMKEFRDAADNASPEQHGEQLYAQNCASCHSIDGSRKIGPSWKGIIGRQGKGSKGESYVADENYITESILYPQKVIVSGYPAAMNSYKGQLSAEDIDHIIAYMKTLK
jgi:cytochrome c oxidase subunit 2